MPQQPTPPVTFSHVGITVPDLDRAVAFYRDALGLYLIMGPVEVTSDDSAIGQMCDDVFGEGWRRFRIAHMATADRVGVELFEFDRTEPETRPFEYWRPGLFHLCVQDPDLEGRVRLIEAHGGRQRMERVRWYHPQQKPYRMVYCEDPFGNIIEIYSHSYELTYSPGAYS
ncbi:MAG: VOC family protein [Planctomycetota bacterium]